ncbi:MAG TPA: hypothetical protein VLJ68_14160 [Chitinophagaceae bacterium]|nr:hypothetical protein [Chitinophagaceae bacterium]
MDNKLNMTKGTDPILDSLDGISRATPQPWFYTRLRARMEKSEQSATVRTRPLLARPIFVVAGLFLVLLMNAFILVKQGSGDNNSQVVEQNEQTLSDSEDLYTSNSSFDIESYVQQ